MSSWTSAASIAIKDRMFRAVTVLRWVVLANAVVTNLYRSDEFTSPAAAAACVGAMSAWTAFATWAYADKSRRRLPLLVADLAIAVAVLLATALVKADDFTASLPGFWILGALFAWAVQYRLLGGLVAGAVLAAADLVRQDDVGIADYGNTFLLVLGGAIVGYLCDSLQRMATERDVAEREAAMATERARLARVVHDGVLQVLALVQRRGLELGGEAADLGRLAGEQERELRALIHAQDALVSPGETLDLSSELGRLERERSVTVSTPGVPVELPAAAAQELVAVIRACLDNVRLHVGEDAPAWVLLQAFPDRVELSVRDDGPGIPPGRLAEAAAQGRLGVTEAIRGRIADLGGTAELTTGSLGTEWEFVVPRPGSLGSKP